MVCNHEGDQHVTTTKMAFHINSAIERTPKQGISWEKPQPQSTTCVPYEKRYGYPAIFSWHLLGSEPTQHSPQFRAIQYRKSSSNTTFVAINRLGTAQRILTTNVQGFGGFLPWFAADGQPLHC